MQQQNLLYTLCYLFSFYYHISLANAQLTQHEHWNLDPVYTGLTVTIFTVLFVISYMVFYYCFHHLRNSGQDGTSQRGLWSGDTTRFGLDPSVLKTFPVFAYSEMSGSESGPDKGRSECAVCLSPFEAGEMLRLLPICDHVFHVSCVDHWLLGHSTCPLCRAKLDQQRFESTLADTARLDELESGLGTGLGNDVMERRQEICTEWHSGNIRRWNSTGHVANIGRLPLDVRNEVLTVKMNRSRSCDARFWSNL